MLKKMHNAASKLLNSVEIFAVFAQFEGLLLSLNLHWPQAFVNFIDSFLAFFALDFNLFAWLIGPLVGILGFITDHMPSLALEVFAHGL